MTIFSNGHFFVVDFIFQSILKKALKVKELLNDQNLQGCLNLFIRLSLCLVSFSFWGCLNFAQWWMCGNGWGLRGGGIPCWTRFLSVFSNGRHATPTTTKTHNNTYWNMCGIANEEWSTGYVVFLLHSYQITSSAGSATLEDTSWGRLYLASWNLPDSQFC